MAVPRVFLLGLALTALSLASALPKTEHIGPDASTNDVTDKTHDAATSQKLSEITILAEIESDDDDDDDDGSLLDPDCDLVLDGIALKYLTADEIEDLLEEDDNMVIADLDIHVTKQLVKERQAGNWQPPRRHKRWGFLARGAAAAARGLFRGSRLTRTSRSGSRLTRQYDRSGGLRQANRDFDRLNPSGQSTFGGRVNGRTGTVGNHRVTVRDGSSHGSPTLEIRSPRPDGSSTVRKFRYPQQQQ